MFDIGRLSLTSAAGRRICAAAKYNLRSLLAQSTVGEGPISDVTVVYGKRRVLAAGAVC